MPRKPRPTAFPRHLKRTRWFRRDDTIREASSLRTVCTMDTTRDDWRLRALEIVALPDVANALHELAWATRPGGPHANDALHQVATEGLAFLLPLPAPPQPHDA